MADDRGFVDHYRVLQIDPNCSASALEAAYRRLAKLYHPDHVETANVEKLGAVLEAYRELKSPEARARYDTPTNRTPASFSPKTMTTMLRRSRRSQMRTCTPRCLAIYTSDGARMRGSAAISSKSC